MGVMNIFKSGLELNNNGQWRWKLSDTGVYTVKTGYALARRWTLSKQRDFGEPSNLSDARNIWERFWKIRSPDRYKLLMWRLYYNSLPVLDKLRRKGGIMGTGCVFCGLNYEDAKHLFLECWWVKSIWQSVGESSVLGHDMCWSSINDWIWYVLKEKDCKFIRLSSIVIWIVWYNRNNAVNGGKVWSIDQCISRINAITIQLDSRTIIGCAPFGYIDPKDCDGMIFFSDGSWSRRLNAGGWASVACIGRVIIRCEAGFLDFCNSGAESELHGLIAALRMAKIMGCRSAHFFCDSSEAIWQLQMGHGELAHDLLKEGLSLLQSNPGWSIHHVFRKKNGFADFLAKKAMMSGWK